MDWHVVYEHEWKQKEHAVSKWAHFNVMARLCSESRRLKRVALHFSVCLLFTYKNAGSLIMSWTVINMDKSRPDIETQGG